MFSASLVSGIKVTWGVVLRGGKAEQRAEAVEKGKGSLGMICGFNMPVAYPRISLSS